MATYEPPTEDLTYPDGFNPLVFQQLTDALTIEEGDARYLRFPLGQGAEQIPTLTVSGTLTAATAVVSGALSAGASTLSSVITNTITGTAVGTPVSLFAEATRSGAINIGTGTTAKTLTIGADSGSTTVNIAGSSIFIGSNNATTVTMNSQGTGEVRLGYNLSGGTLTIGGATGGTTVVNIATGASQTGAINIGTGNTLSSLPITIGNQTGSFGSVDIGSTTIRVGRGNCASNSIETSTGGTLNLKTTASSGGAINMGTGMTSGTIDIGQNGATASTTAITIGNGSNQSGAISIGTGTAASKSITVGNVSGAFGTLNLGCASISIANASNTTALNLGTGMTSGAIILGGTTGGTTTLTLNRPITPAYLPSAITASTQIGFTANTTNNTYVAATVAGSYEIMNVSLPAGVWLCEGCMVFENATGGGRRLGFNTTSANLTNDDRTNGVATGGFAQLQVATVFSFSTTTTVYLNIEITAGLSTVAGENVFNFRRTRIA